MSTELAINILTDAKFDESPPTIAIRHAIRPLIRGEANEIGKRRTPRVSIWPMRDKWEKYGAWWTFAAPDEPPSFLNHVGPVLPTMLQLFYVRLDTERVLQLVWERPDLHWTPEMRPVIGERFSVRRGE